MYMSLFTIIWLIVRACDSHFSMLTSSTKDRSGCPSLMKSRLRSKVFAFHPGRNNIFSRKVLITLTGLILLVSFEHQALAQTPLASCTDVQSSKDFYSLGTKAGELNSEIR